MIFYKPSAHFKKTHIRTIYATGSRARLVQSIRFQVKFSNDMSQYDNNNNL